MIRLASCQLYVNDQDDALAFYTEKLGMEVRQDVTLPEFGTFRWLTVAPASQPDVSIVLMDIDQVPIDDDSREQLRDVVARGIAGTIFLNTDDCRASYEELKGRGVEFVDEPFEQPYGIDSSFRDPAGNHIRLIQVRELSGV